MRHRGTVIDQHRVQGDKSCVAWGVEFIVKLHRVDVALDAYPVQGVHPNGLGFGAETIALLDSYDITAEQKTYDWDEFDTVSKADAELGLPLIFIFPSSLDLNFMSIKFGGGTCHAAVALHFGPFEYLTRAHGQAGIFQIPLHNLYSFLRKEEILPEFRLDCLRHKPKVAVQ